MEKDNEEKIIKSIDEGQFKIGKFRETLAEGALHLGPERDRVVADLTPKEMIDNTQLDSGLTPTDNLIKNLTNTLALLTQSYKTYLPQTNNQLRTSSNIRNQATVQNGRVVVQNVQGRHNKGHMARNYTQLKRPLNLEYFKDKMLLMQVRINVRGLDENIAFIVVVQDMSLMNEVDGHRFKIWHSPWIDVICEHHEEHEMHDDVQPNYVVDSHTDYTSDSNMILYDQYVKDNVVPVVQRNVSSVPNDAYMMIYNDMYEPLAQSVSKTTRNIVVDNSLTTELATYKEQVELYERRARFELTILMNN
ncbi:hypothetical protein Tco_0738132 [Tanacetum coccineum]